MRLCSIDPGGITGIVKADVLDGKIEYTFVGQHKDVWFITQLLDPDIDLVIMEDFVLRKDKALQLAGKHMPASEVIGAIKVACSTHGIPCTLQPAGAKETVSKNILLRTDMWNATKGLPHARDAAKHLLHYCLKNKLIKMELYTSNATV